MLRLLPLLALALLPAAVAAPVPPGGRAEFGTHGLLTRADLEKVTFDTRLYKPADGRDLPDEAEPDKKEQAKEDPAAPRPKNRYDLAVHLPWAKFREGEEMPVYFVMRNNRPEPLGLKSRIDLTGPTPRLQGGGCAFDIRDRETGRSVLKLISASTNCGGGSLVDIPANGFYCQKGDLNRMTGAPLPPGEYEVDWHCGPLAAAPVTFTVQKAAIAPAVKKLPHVHFYHLVSGPDDDSLPVVAGEPFVWRDTSLGYTHAESMAPALAVGQHGVYVPDIRAIPAADSLVEASVEWKPYREGDRVVVTLRAVAPHKQVRFEELPQLFLQLECANDGIRERWDWERSADRKQSERAEKLFVTPLTIEVHLPKDWRERVAASEARVAVLVVAKPIELPRRGGLEVKLAKAEKRVEREPNANTPPVWSGIVRTPSTELRFPPRLPATDSR